MSCTPLIEHVAVFEAAEALRALHVHVQQKHAKNFVVAKILVAPLRVNDTKPAQHI